MQNDSIANCIIPSTHETIGSCYNWGQPNYMTQQLQTLGAFSPADFNIRKIENGWIVFHLGKTYCFNSVAALGEFIETEAGKLK